MTGADGGVPRGRSIARVSELWVYPVKSLRGQRVTSARVEPWGLAGDRRWMVVDESARYVTQRQVPRMATIAAEATSSGVRLSAEDAEICVEAPGRDTEPLRVAIWNDHVDAVAVAPIASEWLSRRLGIPCRLVYMDAPHAARPVSKEFSANAVVSFADAFPILLASSSSLQDLNRRAATSLPMDRFRPNIVVEGSTPWEEDSWRSFTIGGAVLRAVKPCARCVITTIDQITGVSTGAEPLRTLATFRRIGDKGAAFGQNLVPGGSGRVKIGDGIRRHSR